MSLSRPFLDLVSQTPRPRPRGRGRPLVCLIRRLHHFRFIVSRLHRQRNTPSCGAPTYSQHYPLRRLEKGTARRDGQNFVITCRNGGHDILGRFRTHEESVRKCLFGLRFVAECRDIFRNVDPRYSFACLFSVIVVFGCAEAELRFVKEPRVNTEKNRSELLVSGGCGLQGYPLGVWGGEAYYLIKVMTHKSQMKSLLTLPLLM